MSFLGYFINKQLHYQIDNKKCINIQGQQIWLDVTLDKMADISKWWIEIYSHVSKIIKAT